MAVSKRLRYEIFRRDNHACRYCGASAPTVKLTVDHVIPEALGGTDTPDNLVTACEACNSGKTSSTPDASLVAAVTDDAIRWSAAMKQAAETVKERQQPKIAYRETFKRAWDEWTYESNGKRVTFDLPDGWKTSLDNFRTAGLPEEAWADIVETAMTNKTVRSDNLFRYCCGIAWRMVRELQDHAKRIVAPSTQPEALDSVVRAALDVWEGEQSEGFDAEERNAFRASAIAARDHHDAHRIVEAAQYGAWYREPDVAKTLAKVDADAAVQEWVNAWLTKDGVWPDDDRIERVRKQCEDLIAADVYVTRVVRAATYAGSRRSVRLYFGLTEQELDITKQHEFVVRSAELWTESFNASASRWPTQDELNAFFKNLFRVGDDTEGFWIDDIYRAASAAGAYQDPDISSCLTRHLSVFEAASRPLQTAS